MSTRSRIAIINKDGSITSSYVHYDGYLTGVGYQLLKNYNNGQAASRVARMGYASSLHGTVKESKADATHKENPLTCSIKEFIEDVKRSDLEFVYVWMKTRQFYVKDEVAHWKVFKRGPWNSEIDWVGLDKLEHRCGGNPLDYEFVIDALVVVDNIRSRDNDLYLQKEYLSHANELEHFAYKTALENRTKGLFQIGSLIEKADKYFKEVA